MMRAVPLQAQWRQPARDELSAFMRGALAHSTEPHGCEWWSDAQ